MRARDAMIPNPLVVRPETTLLEFIHAVLDGNQTTASVVDGETLVGMLSVEDVFQRLVPAYLQMRGGLVDALRDSYYFEAFEKFKHLQVGAVMSRDIDCLAPDAPLMNAVRLFAKRSRKTLPVLEEGRYVGSVTRRSVLRAALDKANS